MDEAILERQKKRIARWEKKVEEVGGLPKLE